MKVQGDASRPAKYTKSLGEAPLVWAPCPALYLGLATGGRGSFCLWEHTPRISYQIFCGKGERLASKNTFIQSSVFTNWDLFFVIKNQSYVNTGTNR